ncbi:MAG: hypothetical protein WBB60_17395 [Nitrospira sp.]|nr:hypothetical protein [Nitrospira sp.]HQY59217.1 hypothetical protein [Nitrospira sp.]HRA96717.1 hypothetical protein [Nitrospira sp.]
MDAIIPHGPKISGASREYLLAMAIKGLASELGDKTDRRMLVSIQQTLVKLASERLAADYGVDASCGTPPWKKFTIQSKFHDVLLVNRINIFTYIIYAPQKAVPYPMMLRFYLKQAFVIVPHHHQ